MKNKKHCDSRKGDLAEYYAVTWLWDEGYEVFKNCGCTGTADLIAMRDKEIILIDVKTAQPQRHKKIGNNFTKCCSRTKEQVEEGIQLLQFNAVDRSLYFTKHRDKNYEKK
jgi:Holliday junction resolvase-like predicted endonuclease|tara:strand:- start:25 stop:357 length:333 start_codon:yes stop_codon:yes gene_type:complete